MTFTYEDKISFNSLSFDYKEEILGITLDRIKDDDDLMNEIRIFCEEELKEYRDTTLTLQNLIDLKLDEIAQEALDKASIYIETDIEVEI
jgi:hypothetical protein